MSRHRSGFRPNWMLIALVLASSESCTRKPPPGSTESLAPTSSTLPLVGNPVLPKELAGTPKPPASTAAAPLAVPEADYKGPWFAVTASAAGVYVEPSFDAKRIGYLRSGGKTAVEPNPAIKKGCTSGWYKVLAGGFLCGNLGTTDLNNAQVRFATTAPKLDDVLPYPYARNAKNGTPLYKSVPSREQMNKYEPYLTKREDKSEDGAEKPKRTRIADLSSERDGGPSVETLRASLDSALADAGVAAPPNLAAAPAEAEPEKPWWQQEDIKDRLHEVTLNDLSVDADDVLAKRMVSGFYVAVDKTFMWNGRSWYKTTRGLVTPSDRFWQTSGPKFKGVELGDSWRLPVAWVYGGNKHIATYNIDAAANTIQPSGTLDHFAPVQLTGKELEFHGQNYLESADGTWLKSSQIRSVHPGPPPEGLAPNERWIDVNLSTQTLVAFEGDRAVYATLISSGKESKIKDKDHRTPVGEWRIREKHITTTMDGDGTAAGDLPYSIEDVPYVMYFHRSYALHGAFWHANFGVQMSHGCVNLAPLDAKYLFFFADPQLPKGWHGVLAAEARPGSRVVLHM